MGDRKEKKGKTFLSFSASFPSCPSPTLVGINNNGKSVTSQQLTGLGKNVVLQSPLIKTSLLLAKTLSQSFDQMLMYPARDIIPIFVCFAVAGGRSREKSRLLNYMYLPS